ncbi:DUF1273 domain-containing protein [Paenibacillus sp. MZ04-78.2]|uniref:DUF1273 domain-containing protein n=1 Tax=Paenibacillus sp. MZ04-78.2 TaxID=2962034 RepID=UPI0020B8424F|nr:DUF1273 domain-containing protein [Paenibacillus sp. MZ04-78.2]MCP3776492.1 DUF1273 domain-containing protein [Paenibacillus sp. MZ04-78.2]
MKSLLVTGYKASELGIFSLKHPGIGIIKKALKSRFAALLDEGLEWVIVSGQWGVELWAAEAALEMKSQGFELKLAVIPPFLEQEANWSEEKQAAYKQVLAGADYVNSVTKSNYSGPWQFRARDQFLLRNSDGLLLVYDDENEGSPKFIREEALRLADQEYYPIHSITAYDLQSTAEEEATLHPYDE